MSETRRKLFPTTDQTAVAAEPLVKLGTRIPKRLNKLLDLACVEREMKKEDLVTEIFERYFAGQQ
jgi:hypothetical protein